MIPLLYHLAIESQITAAAKIKTGMYYSCSSKVSRLHLNEMNSYTFRVSFGLPVKLINYVFGPRVVMNSR